MRTYMEKVGATYYFRRVVPKELRPYFLTERGNHRTEFKISLETKDRREADRRLEIKSVEISEQIDEAERRYLAGIPPGSESSERDERIERWQREQDELQAIASHENIQREFQEDEAVTALLNALRRPASELSPEQLTTRLIVTPELLEPPEVQQSRETSRKVSARRGAELAVADFRAGKIGKAGYLTCSPEIEAI